jgi:hypothetical protein
MEDREYQHNSIARQRSQLATAFSLDLALARRLCRGARRPDRILPRVAHRHSA